MLDNYKKDPDLTAMVDMFDWYVLPVANPDGYAYTWTGQNVSNIFSDSLQYILFM